MSKKTPLWQHGRVNEVATLRWGDITFHNNYDSSYITIKNGLPTKVTNLHYSCCITAVEKEPTDCHLCNKRNRGQMFYWISGCENITQTCSRKDKHHKSRITSYLPPHSNNKLSTGMLKIYAHLTVSDVENAMNQIYDVNPESRVTALPDIATPIQCKRCGLISQKSHEFCGGCTAPPSGKSGDVQTKHEELLKMLERKRHVRQIERIFYL